MRIVIFGASGLLGTALMKELSISHKVIGTFNDNKKEGLVHLDATDYFQVESILLKHRPEIVIDAIGIPNVGLCEEKPLLAERINHLTAKNISQACKKIDAKIIFISSSQIYGNGDGNYSESDSPSPSTIYAKTKLGGEEEISKLENSIILRPEFIYGYNGPMQKNDLVDVIRQSSEILIRNPNQLRQPLLAGDISKAIVELIKKDFRGVLNIGGKNFIKKLSCYGKRTKAGSGKLSASLNLPKQEEGKTTE